VLVDDTRPQPDRKHRLTAASLLAAPRRLERRVRPRGTNPLRSPCSLYRTTNGRSGVYEMTDTEAGSTTMRWKLSRCIPSASARSALITSPWLTATHMAASPFEALIRAFQSRTASTARDCICRSDSPPGNVAPLGCP